MKKTKSIYEISVAIASVVFGISSKQTNMISNKQNMINRTYLFAAALLSLISCQKTGAEPGKEPLPVLPEAESTYILQSCEDITSYQSHSISNKASLYMAKGEAEHFQIVITTGKKGKLSVKRENPLDGLSCEVYEIREFNGKDDVLIPCERRQIETKTKIVKIWVSYRSSRTIAPGDYQEIITFSGSAGEYKVGVDARVYDVEMPVASALPSLMGINTSMIDPSAKGEPLLAKRRIVSDMLLERRLTPFFCTWWAGTMQTQCSSSPYFWSDARTAEYLADPRMTHVLMPNIDMSIEDMRSSADNLRKLDPDKKHVYYVWDEPSEISTYDKIRQLSDDVHKADADGKVITTFYCGPTDKGNNNLKDILSVWDHLSGATSYFSTSTWLLAPSPAQRSKAFADKCAEGQEWWTYVCMAETPGLAYNSSGFQNRASVWRSYFDGNKGFLYWAVNAFSSLYPLRSRSDLPSGDGILVYPGDPFGADGFIPSLRLERFADGLEDYDLLKMVESKTSRAKALEILAKVYKSNTEIALKASAVTSFKKELLETLTK